MPDCFISYSREDQRLADFVYSVLRASELTVFMAPTSLRPGEQWASEIVSQLNASSWVVFLASRAACRSPWVQQELGMALQARKKLVPVVWDMPSSDLPGWVNQRQALVLGGRTAEDVKGQIEGIAEMIKEAKWKGALIAGALLMGLLYLALREP